MRHRLIATLGTPLAIAASSTACGGETSADRAVDASVGVRTEPDASAPFDANAGGRDAGTTAKCNVTAASAVDDAGACPSATVELELVAMTGSWFISSTEDNDVPGADWLTFFCSADTQLYSFFTEAEAIDCRTCTQTTPIPLGGFTTALPDGGAVGSWNGLFYAPGTCGAMSTPCLTPMCASPGAYIAEMCACPDETCATRSCVEVPFDYPSSGLVTGTLP